MKVLLSALFVAGGPVPAAGLPAAAERKVDFVKDIQPIFAAKCLQCHGPEKQKSGYRLDVRATALSGGDHHSPNIVPGKSGQSPLVRFVSGADPDMIMPAKGERLTTGQIGLLRAWIDQGADWPDSASAKGADPLDWWSLRPLVLPPVPAAAAAESAGGRAAGTNPIDAFVSAKLTENGLTMSPEADPRTLCRRLYFDLTGLPPSPEELASFVSACGTNDRSTINHQLSTLADRLLASPRYGERWARHWLDVVHYGDTHGYDKDKLRPNAWPYRDYVIRALNADKPYARFVQEQIAGDALFPGTQDGVEALGFIAAGPWDFIGHAELPEDKIDGKVARHLDRDDMAGNAMGTFCSTTIQCAQCHHHKFDPISQDDYYSVQAVFAAVDRADKSYDLDPAVAQRRSALTARLRALETKEKEFTARIVALGGAELAEMEKKIAAAGKSVPQGVRPEYGWHSGIGAKQELRKWVQVDLGRSVAIERVVLAGVWDDFNGIGAGFGFPVRFRIEAGDDADFGGTPAVIAAHDLEDYPNPGTAPQTFAASKVTARYVRITATKLAPRQNDFIFAVSELEVIDASGKNTARDASVTALDSIEMPVRWTRKNLTDGIYPAATGASEELAALRRQREDLVIRVTDGPTRRELAETAAARAAAQRQLAQLPPAKLVYAGTVYTGDGVFRGTGANGGKPRPIHVLARGQVTAPVREVTAGALSALKSLPARFDAAATESDRRAALAHWITHRDHPLTWRSIVNRVWQYHFGRGLVDTPNDFGRMGGTPTHPELLDWLAVTFRDDMGGSLKRLHKLIVMSAAWRQRSARDDSGATAADSWQRAQEIDNHNTLLWRQGRRKLEAESVRDAVLAVSGTLDVTMGGPGWQDFVIEHPEHSPHYEYHLADPEDRKTWRRSIYRFIVRSQMQPWMTCLDCADPSIRVDRRNESVSAPQALALLNNGFMLVQARCFAERVQREAGGDTGAAVTRAFLLATGREPAATEREMLADFAGRHGLPNMCRVILNLNEFAFVD